MGDRSNGPISGRELAAQGSPKSLGSIAQMGFSGLTFAGPLFLLIKRKRECSLVGCILRFCKTISFKKKLIISSGSHCKTIYFNDN